MQNERETMQQLSARVEYALLAVMDLARHASKENPAQVGRVAARTGAPEKYLVQLLQHLRKALIVHSKRGRAGGYYLRRPPRQISVAQVIDAIAPRESLFPDSDTEATPARKAVRSLWRRLDEQRKAELARVSIDALLTQADGGASEPGAEKRQRAE